MEPDLGPGYRLIAARQQMKRAVIAVDLAILDTPPAVSFAGSDAARDAYRGLTEAARELVAAQDAFDAHCEAKRVERFGPDAEKAVRAQLEDGRA